MERLTATKHVSLFSSLPAQSPVPEATKCAESIHRTLAHLVACQIASLPFLSALAKGKSSARYVEHPLRLQTSLGLVGLPWEELLRQYVANAKQWDEDLSQIPTDATIKINQKPFTAKTLTEKLLAHERHHLAEHNLVA